MSLPFLWSRWDYEQYVSQLDSPGRRIPFQKEHSGGSEPNWQSWCKRSSEYHHRPKRNWTRSQLFYITVVYLYIRLFFYLNKTVSYSINNMCVIDRLQAFIFVNFIFSSTMRTHWIAKVVSWPCLYMKQQFASQTHHLLSGAEFNTTSLDFIQVALNGL